MAFDDLKTNRNAKLDNDMKELSDGTLCRLRSDQLRSAYLERAWRPRRRLTALLSDVFVYLPSTVNSSTVQRVNDGGQPTPHLSTQLCTARLRLRRDCRQVKKRGQTL